MLIKQILRLWKNYIKGQFILMIFVMGSTFLSGLALGMPFCVPLSILAGITENIPRIGPVSYSIIAALLCLWKGSSYLDIPHWVFALIIIAVTFLIQQIEDWLVTPKVYGNAVDMNPIIILIGMACFAAIPGIGFICVLFAVPILAAVREIFQYLFYREDYLQKCQMQADEQKKLPIQKKNGNL